MQLTTGKHGMLQLKICITDNLQAEIKSLITNRFDEILNQKEDHGKVKNEVKEESAATDGGHSERDSPALSMPSPNSSIKMEKIPSKRGQTLDDDAKLAAKLHEELNAGRPSRSTSATQKKKAAPKKKAVKKSKAEVDSNASSDETGEPEKKKRAINRANPFNVSLGHYSQEKFIQGKANLFVGTHATL